MTHLSRPRFTLDYENQEERKKKTFKNLSTPAKAGAQCSTQISRFTEKRYFQFHLSRGSKLQVCRRTCCSQIFISPLFRSLEIISITFSWNFTNQSSCRREGEKFAFVSSKRLTASWKAMISH